MTKTSGGPDVGLSVRGNLLRGEKPEGEEGKNPDNKSEAHVEIDNWLASRILFSLRPDLQPKKVTLALGKFDGFCKNYDELVKLGCGGPEGPVKDYKDEWRLDAVNMNKFLYVYNVCNIFFLFKQCCINIALM